MRVLAAASVIPLMINPVASLGGPDRSWPSAAPPPLDMPYTNQSLPADRELLALRQLALSSEERSPVGRYTYVRTLSWTEQPAGPETDPQTIKVVDEQIWWATDLSGRRVITTLPPQPSNQQLTKWTNHLPPKTSILSVDNFAPDKFPTAIRTPSDDPPILASQLHDQPIERGSQGTIRAIADLYAHHHLTIQQRAAVLRILADTRPLYFGGGVVDRAGRQGIAVFIDSNKNTTRDIAIFDSTNGSLLSYERVTLFSDTHSSGPGRSVNAYIVYLTSRRTDDLDRPPAVIAIGSRGSR